jgi:cation diffusion facilitator family transporter
MDLTPDVESDAINAPAARDVTGAGREPFRAGVVAVALGLLALALKGYAAWRSESLALLADAAESVVNVVAALVATASVSGPPRSADGSPPEGHGRLELLSAGIEGALVVLVAFVVAFESIARYGQSPQLAAVGVALACALAATGLNAGLSRYLEGVGRRHRSPALLADALHLRHDVVTSLVVYAGFGVAWTTRWWPLDALLALGVSIHILISGLRAVRQSVSGQLDETLPAGELAAVEARLRAEGPPVVGFHDLRTRRVGGQLWIDLHLVVSRYALVYEAYEICDRIEADLERLHPGVRVAIDVVPEGEARRVRPQRAPP